MTPRGSLCGYNRPVKSEPPVSVDADPIVEFYKRGVDKSLIIEYLGKPHEERLITLENVIAFIHRLHSPGMAVRREGVPPATTQFKALLTSLSDHDVSFVIIGGAAAALHGSARVTYDLDIVYDRSFDNLERIVRSLAPFRPYIKGAPPGLPFRFDADALKRGLNFTFATSAGTIDLLGYLAGIGSFDTVRASTVDIDMFGARYRLLCLDALIVSKVAPGRAKDLEGVAELETIRELLG